MSKTVTINTDELEPTVKLLDALNWIRTTYPDDWPDRLTTRFLVDDLASELSRLLVSVLER
jgi:hypothetical protein